MTQSPVPPSLDKHVARCLCCFLAHRQCRKFWTSADSSWKGGSNHILFGSAPILSWEIAVFIATNMISGSFSAPKSFLLFVFEALNSNFSAQERENQNKIKPAGNGGSDCDVKIF
jgi:hypothetical protein